MSKLRRRLSARIFSGLLIAIALTAAGTVPAAAAPAASHITIQARSPHYPGARHGLVDGHALVIYRSGTPSQRHATISGAVATSARNETATLLSKPFGSSSYSAARTPLRLTPSHGSAGYTFTVAPTVATRYRVRVSGSGTSATSQPVTVYVTAGGRDVAHTGCGKRACTYRMRVYTYVPASAYRTESRKHAFLYLAVGRPGHLPADYTLSAGATETSARRVGAGEYERTMTWHIRLRYSITIWRTIACTKDTEQRDGMGLPGHHGCGNRHVSRSASYLG